MRALIIVDIQNDFMPGGALPVQEGNRVIPVINKLQNHFDLILATKDWHPFGHKSFASQHGKKPFQIIDYKGSFQELWPDHCIQGTKGSDFSAELDLSKISKIFYKGIDPEVDSYSAFFDNAHIRSTGLLEYLQNHNIREIVIVGLATDYCVKYSVLDAIQNGLEVIVIKDACRAVELQPGDEDKAFTLMEAIGAQIMSSEDYIKQTLKKTC